jgi:hypothetical protein
MRYVAFESRRRRQWATCCPEESRPLGLHNWIMTQSSCRPGVERSDRDASTPRFSFGQYYRGGDRTSPTPVLAQHLQIASEAAYSEKFVAAGTRSNAWSRARYQDREDFEPRAHRASTWGSSRLGTDRHPRDPLARAVPGRHRLEPQPEDRPWRHQGAAQAARGPMAAD